MNKFLLHAEGFAVLILSLYFYGHSQFSWIAFGFLLFTPDLSMIGYFFNHHLGSLLYNLFHTYSLSIVLIMFALLLSNQNLLAIGLILSAHMGMDRMMGYGLKYPSAFKETHLQRV